MSIAADNIRSSNVATKSQLIFIFAPKTLRIQHVGEKLGYKHLESHFAYVHRTLTREVAVFEKE